MLSATDFPTRNPQLDIADACNADLRNVCKAICDKQLDVPHVINRALQ